jgi:hypothetical protein
VKQVWCAYMHISIEKINFDYKRLRFNSMKRGNSNQYATLILVIVTIILIECIVAFIPQQEHLRCNTIFESTRACNNNIHCVNYNPVTSTLRSTTKLFINNNKGDVETSNRDSSYRLNNDDHEEIDNPNSNIRGGKRREVVGSWIRKALFMGLGYKTATSSSVTFAKAADENSVVTTAVNGRIVTLQIQNLNGVEGQTGNIKIQLAPTWAPRGVARFEVSNS